MSVSLTAHERPPTPPTSPAATQPRSAGAETLDACIAQHRRLQFEVARYIEELLGELGNMARAAELRHLFYFLDLTRLEAGVQQQRLNPER